MAVQKWVEPQGEVVGIDPSSEMIQVARQNAAREGSQVRFEMGVIEALLFPDASFDVVLNRLMLHHLLGGLKQRGWKEVRRVLKHGGICLVLDFESPKSWLLRIMMENHMARMANVNIREYVPLLEDAGFTEVESGPTSMKMLPYVRGKVAPG
jgi:ubiquinone/menaquinone biosynthesis C-methylase UbiE